MHQSIKLFRVDILPLLGGLVTLVAGGVFANPAVASERDQAIDFARQGRCVAALEIFEALREGQAELGRDALVEQLTGECALRTQEFRRAETALARARALEPTTQRVDLHLAMAHFHQGEVDEAEAALGRVPESDRNEPEFLLYSGLVALEQTEFESAAQSLGEASRLKESAPEPMASFFLARALAELDRLDEADAAFGRVIEEFPESRWADQAQAAKKQAHSEAGLDVEYWGAVEFGLEYDDNVVLRGQDVPLPTQISGEGDGRGFWFVDAGALTDLNDEWRLGGLLRYAGTANFDIRQFNVHAPGATLWLDRVLTKQGAALRLQYDLDGTWVNEDPFLVRHLATTSYYHPWEKWGQTVLSASFGHSQYYYPRFQAPDAPSGALPGDACPDPTATPCGPFGINERSRTNRTGNGLTATVFHRLPIAVAENPIAKDLFISGEYSYHRYWARGAEYDRHRNQIEVEVGATLPLEIGLSVGGRFGYSIYDNNSVFPDRDSTALSTAPPEVYALPSRRRRERETGAWVRLERAITDQVRISAYYRHTDNSSNTEVFDYERNVAGMSIRVALGG